MQAEKGANMITFCLMYFTNNNKNHLYFNHILRSRLRFIYLHTHKLGIFM